MTIIVWDTGTWKATKADDPAAEVRAGELHAVLQGSKLCGHVVLIRTGAPGDRGQWLLMHKHDEHAAAGWDAEDHPHSVLTGRTNEEVKADPDRLWRSDVPAARAAVPLKVEVPEGPTAQQLAVLDGLGSRGR